MTKNFFFRIDRPYDFSYRSKIYNGITRVYNGPCTVRPTLFLNFLSNVEQTERYEIDIFFDWFVYNVTSVLIAFALKAPFLSKFYNMTAPKNFCT